MRMPLPAARMIALGTTLLIIFLSLNPIADPLVLVNSGGSGQKKMPILNQALLERILN
jgi:hypothetical protein